jgi:flagellar basal-body rod protein FlgF
MDRMIYTAMNSAKQSFDQQALASHNLANVTTPGFRAQLSTMESLPLQGDGLKTRTLPLAGSPGADQTQGPVMTTERTLDVALQGGDWLAVQDANGTEAYTKRGDMQIDANGMLTGQGRPVRGEGGPILLPLDSQITIGANGVISVIEPGQTPDAIAEVARLKVVTAGADQIERGLDGLFRAVPGADGQVRPFALNENARVTAGALEGSNVSPTEAMVAMINTARRYEMQMKVISTADENAQRANGLLKLS